jgi:hypothetical protein
MKLLNSPSEFYTMEISRIFLSSKYIFRNFFFKKISYSLLINSSEILLLKRLISNQVSHLIENIPQTDSIDVNLKFISDEEQFKKAVNQTFGRFFTHKELKLSYLNNLTNSSSNTIINPNFELNATIAALSPSDSSNDERSGGVTRQQVSASNFGVSQYDEVSVNQVVSKMHHQILSPAQSNESSSSNGQSQWHNGKLKTMELKLIENLIRECVWLIFYRLSFF